MKSVGLVRTLIVVIADIIVVGIAIGTARAIGVGMVTCRGFGTSIVAIDHSVAIVVRRWTTTTVGIGMVTIGCIRASIIDISHAIVVGISIALTSPFLFTLALTLALPVAIPISISVTRSRSIVIVSGSLIGVVIALSVASARTKHDRDSARPELRITAVFVRAN
jgi:hypothetical protein